MQGKPITIILAASGEQRLVTVAPGTAPRDVVHHLGLEGYVLSRDGSTLSLLPPDQDIYPMVHPGEVLWASLVPEVGCS